MSEALAYVSLRYCYGRSTDDQGDAAAKVCFEDVLVDAIAADVLSSEVDEHPMLTVLQTIAISL